MRKQWLGLCTGLFLAACGGDWGLDQRGQKVTAKQLADQWLVVNYWAQWCQPCRREIPELNRLQRELQGQSVRVVGISFDGLKGAALARASAEMAIDFSVLADDPASRLKLPEPVGLPVTYIIGADGRLREQLLGEQTAESIRRRLAHWRNQAGEPLDAEAGR